MISPVTLIFTVAQSTKVVLPDTISPNELQKTAKKIILLERKLFQAIQILAVMVILAVLATKTLGLSIKQVIQIQGLDIFPTEISYVYGLYFTLFLGVVYGPQFLILRERKE